MFSYRDPRPTSRAVSVSLLSVFGTLRTHMQTRSAVRDHSRAVGPTQNAAQPPRALVCACARAMRTLIMRGCARAMTMTLCCGQVRAANVLVCGACAERTPAGALGEREHGRGGASENAHMRTARIDALWEAHSRGSISKDEFMLLRSQL